MPSGVAKQMNRIPRQFFWRGVDNKYKIHTVSCETVCASKEKGGLRIRDMQTMNRALLHKWHWRFARNSNDLLKVVLSDKYVSTKGKWSTKRTHGAVGSSIWPNICKVNDQFWQHVTYSVQSGERIMFWGHTWLGHSPLRVKFPKHSDYLNYRMV